MVEIRNYPQRAYPADTRTMGSDNSRPPSGYFSLHVTYPDTEYEDPVTFTWGGGGTNRPGMHFLIRTNLAADTTGSTSYSDDENLFIIDLKRAQEAADRNSVTIDYSLGTEASARFIAAAINSSRGLQIGEHDRRRYLRAKYQKMSGRTLYRGESKRAIKVHSGGSGDFTLSASAVPIYSSYTLTLSSGPTDLFPGDSLYTIGPNSRFIGTVLDVNGTTVYLEEPNQIDLASGEKMRTGRLHLGFGDTAVITDNEVPLNRLPTNIPQRGTITVGSNTLYYDSWKIVQQSTVVTASQTGELVFNIYDVASDPSSTADYAADTEFTVNVDTEEQHTVVMTWESEAPTGGGYWGTANGGPIVQGLGAPLPVWYLTAKPMDGGNMGLPDVSHESRGAQPSALSGHGYSRFSIEGLNSCALPDLPPPDMPFDGPAIMGETSADPFQWSGLNNARSALADDDLLIEHPEFKTEMDSGGPFGTDCIVSANSSVSGTTDFKVLAPGTSFREHFAVGDVIYTKDGDAIGTIDSIADTHTTDLKVLGPREAKTGAVSDSSWSVGASNLTTVNDASSEFATGDVICLEDGSEVAEVSSVSTHTIHFVGTALVAGGEGVTLYKRSVSDLSLPIAPTAGIDYTKEHFDDGRPLLVYSATDGTSPEQFGAGGGRLDSYATDDHPRTILSSASDQYGKITDPQTHTPSVKAGAPEILTIVDLTQMDVSSITKQTELYRACVEVTLTSNVSVTLENGQPLFKSKDASKWTLALENGYSFTSTFPQVHNGFDNEHTHITGLSQSTVDKAKAVTKNGLKSENNTITTSTKFTQGAQGYVCRPYRVTRDVTTERVRGLQIPNEERVWDNIEVVDDRGQRLTLEGGSPFGTVIKDFTYRPSRVDPNTGNETTLPSVVASGLEPNLEINLPSQDEIPGNIIVRSGHDRVQAWRNLSWGMGGLNAPTFEDAGVPEVSNETTSFDTHDRVLHFHPVRILHNEMNNKFGMGSHGTVGAVPSGSTRLYAAHRLSDHAERGSVLKDTSNGADGSYLHPHHRIRFGRQGHHFVLPFTTRGTPISLRRQLHRSHGAAYSLLFEAETEHKHWGFQSNYNGATDTPSSTLYYLDTLDVKSETYNTGSFASDGFPMGELSNAGLPNWRRYDGSAPDEQVDLLFAPGQTLVNVEGAKEQVRFVSAYHARSNAKGPYANAATAGPIAIETASARTVNNHHHAGEEFMVNGFILGNYHLMGGRPDPAWIDDGHEGSDAVPYYYALTGLAPGWHVPRVATELGTTPPLLTHDPALVNASAAPVAKVESPSSASDFDAVDTHQDLALLGHGDTNSGATPDAFLCTWLAEYSHPALLGTNREHYMTFRYREAGMPGAVDQPALRSLLLRNAPETRSSSVDAAAPFERIYAVQWLQQYGYNALNAGGHGTDWGVRAAGAVLMGHSGLREPQGTLELRQHFVLHGSARRMSRGEGIGDGLNPRKDVVRWYLDKDATNTVYWNEVTAVHNPMVAIDVSRRLPVRAFGFRSGSDALNMLAGDPTETSTSMGAILRSARFDGGKHDSLNDMPTGGDWPWPSTTTYTGVERNVPIGFVISQQTNEGIDGSGFNRLSNEPWEAGDQRAGMGRVLQREQLGMVDPRAMPAGLMDAHRTEFATITGSTAKFLQAKSVNTGSDPIIGLNHHTGDRTKAAGSIDALFQASEFGASVGSEFYHHKGQNLHINAHPVDVKAHTSTDTQHFPAVGWGYNLNMKNKSEAERGTLPIPLHEIADHRQVQSDLSPRLGLSVETQRERTQGLQTEYAVTSTKAVSLHSDLAVGQLFPVTPSWVQDTRWTKTGASTGSVTTTAARPDEVYGGRSDPNQRSAKPKWSLNEDDDLNGLSNPFSDDVLQSDGAGIRDHWAVRGSADLPAWGGVFILRKTWLDRPENSDRLRSHQGGTASTTQAAVAQPVRRYADYIVRVVRPLKVYGYTSQNDAAGTLMNQDGWLLGPYSTITQTGSKDQPFTRDKRYGIFETTTNNQTGDIEVITSPYDTAPTIEWPDANERDAVWHLIPTANMLQHFKSDAARRDRGGRMSPTVDARYSQSTHPGGGETISQTETVYATDDTMSLDPYFRRDKDANAVRKQPAQAMSASGPRATVKFHGSSTLVVDDATAFPPAGNLIILGLTGRMQYTARTENTFTFATRTGEMSSIADLAGREVRLGLNSSTTVASSRKHLLSDTMPLACLPSLVDNAVSVGILHNDKWDATSSDDSEDFSTNIAYRGIGHYDPTDFFMVTPQRFALTDGQNAGSLAYRNLPGTGGLSTVYTDGYAIGANTFHPYLIDASSGRWRIAGVQVESGNADVSDTRLVFKGLGAETLSEGGINLNGVRLGHFMGVGVRTTDAALLLLGDTGAAVPGVDLTEFRIAHEQKRTDTGVYDAYSSAYHSKTASRTGFLFAHPSLGDMVLHSPSFISRKARGIGVLDVLRDLSRIDGHQLTVSESGLLIYTPEVFTGRGRRVGSSSGPQSITVSKMLEMASRVIVEGDEVARNEIVRGEVKDLEKMRQMGGAGGEAGVERMLRVSVPGVRDRGVALRLARGLLQRTEQGSALIRVEGLLNCTDIQPGEIINVDFSMENIRGEFAVFEATHNYNTGLTNIVIGQFEKGIEGLLADLQSSVSSTQNEDPASLREQTNISFSAPIRVVASSRVLTRFVNGTRLLIGGRHRGSPTTHQLGSIGVRGGWTGVLINNGGGYSASAGTTLTVDGVDATTRFSQHDAVLDGDHALVGFVSSVTATSIVLKANNLIALSDDEELRVSSNRMDPVGHSKSVFYEVR